MGDRQRAVLVTDQRVQEEEPNPGKVGPREVLWASELVT